MQARGSRRSRSAPSSRPWAGSAHRPRCESLRGDLATVETVLSILAAQDLQRQLSSLTSGEGVLETTFLGYEPVSGDPPTRRRTTVNALNREEYMLHVVSRAYR